MRRLVPAVLQRNPAYARLWAGKWTSKFGSQFTYMTFPLVAYAITGSGQVFAGVVFATTIGVLLAGLVGGAIADRFDRQRTLIAGDAVLVVLVVGIALAVHARIWPMFVGLVFLQAIVGALSSSTASLQRDLIAEPDRSAANALEQLAQNACQLSSPLVGVALYTVVGFTAVICVDVVTFIISIVCVLGVRDPRGAERRAHAAASTSGIAEGARQLRRDIRGGLRLARHDRFLSAQIAGALFAGVANGAFFIALVPWTVRTLDLPVQAFSLLIGWVGATGVISALILTRLGDRFRPERLVFVGAVVGIAGSLALLGTPPLWLVVIGIGAFGVANVTNNVGGATIMQRRFDPDTLGRVMSLHQNAFMLTHLIGIAGTGLLIDVVAPTSILAVFSIGMAICFGLEIWGLRFRHGLAHGIADDGTLVARAAAEKIATADADLAVSG